MDAADRKAIADALNAVDPPATLNEGGQLKWPLGLDVGAYYRQVTLPGHGVVKFAGALAAENGFGYVARWQAWLVLPQDLRQAEEWLEAHHPLIEQAMKRVWVPTAITPASLVFDQVALNGVIYEGTR